MMGRLLVITGPSGVGKTSLADRLCRDGFSRCITCTTREPRQGEKEGVDYFFLSPELFLTSKDNGEFVETNAHYGQQYGVRQNDMALQTQKGDVVVLLNWQGALKVKEVFPKALVVFVSPPSMDELSERLGKRGDPVRMQYAQEDMDQQNRFEHVIINDDLDVCYQSLLALISTKMD